MKRITVDTERLRNGDPCVRIWTADGEVWCREASIVGPSSVKHWPTTPLPGGGTVFVETTAIIRIDS